MRISDVITAYILHRMDQAEDGWAELKRNELADQLGCVPSQINYVLTSRFTPEQGYVVESRRGGGGFVRIRRIQYQPQTSPLMHIVNALGNSVSAAGARAILENLQYQKIIRADIAELMAVAVSDRALCDAPPGMRDSLRATLLKCLLTACMD